MRISCSVCVKSEICTTFMKQNVAGMQVFSATVSRSGQSGSRQVTDGSKLGLSHMAHPGHVYGSMGHVGPRGHVGHWAIEFM